MGLQEEVAAGQLDGLLVDALRQQARRTVVGRPTPSGSTLWAADDIDELVNDMLTNLSGGLGTLPLKALEATSDAEFSGWLRKVLRTTLNRRARGTHTGRLIRAIDDALSKDEVFVLSNGTWALRTNLTPAPVDRDELLVAAWSVETPVHRLTGTTAKVPLLAGRKAIRGVAEAVLAVSGPLSKIDLTEILSDRFNVTFEEHLSYLEEDDVPDAALPDCTAEDLDAARWLVDQLTEDERAIMALWSTTNVRGTAAALGWTKHRVEKVKAKAEDKIRRLCVEFGSEADDVIRALTGILGQVAAVRHSAEVDGGDHGQ